MMNVTTLHSASGSAKYYASYYEQKEYAQWYGKGAEMLGLKGAIKEADFLALLEGKLPNGQELGRNGKDGKWEHRPGYDLTTSAPKSFSIMMLGDKELINLHIKATMKVIDFIQNEYIFARNKVDGKEKAILTNNLISGLMTQFFSRELDMQLHTHIILMNATHDGEKFRSLLSDPFSKDNKYLGLVYRNILAELVQQRGYEIVETGKEGFWEFRDVPRSAIEQFSKRRASIEKYAADMKEAGINVDMQIANKATRPNKDESVGIDALMEALKKEMGEGGHISMDDIDKTVEKSLSRGSVDINDEKTKVQLSVQKATQHLMGYQDVFSRDRLVKQSRAYGIGCDIGLLKHEIDLRISEGHLVADKKLNLMDISTHGQIQQNTELMKNGRLDKISYKFFAKLASLGMIERSTPAKKEQLVSLLTTKSQYVALNSNDRDGYDILKAFGGIVRNSRYYNVTAVIPTALSKQSFGERQELLGTKGVYTLSGLTKYWGKQFAEGARLPNAGQQIFVVDKAHLFKTEAINELMVLADKLKARVVFNVKSSLGKLNNQLGGCHSLLEKGMEQIGVVDTRSLEDKISSLQGSNRIHVIEGYEAQEAHIKKVCLENSSVPIVVVPTASLKAVLNEDIRQAMVDAGRIDKNSISVNILDKVPMSDVDRQMTHLYQEDYIVRGDGKYYQVKAVDRELGVIKLVNSANNEYKEWNLANKCFKTIDVYQQKELALAKGDNLMWTRTVTIDGEKRRRNCLIEVMDVSDRKNIKIKDNFGKEFVVNTSDLNQQHFNRPYARTIQESMYKDSKIDILYCPNGKIEPVNSHTCLGMLSRRGQVVVSDIGCLGGTSSLNINIEAARDVTERDARDIVADNSVVHGMLKLSERNAVFRLKDLKKEALEYCGSRVSLDDINNAIDRSFDNKELVDTKASANELVVDDAVLLTSKDTITTEKQCVQLMQESKGKFQSILEVDNPLLKGIRNHAVLNEGQKAAIEFIVTSRDGVSAVQGVAGTGKTYMMKEVVKLCNEMDINIVGIVNTTSGKHELGREIKSVVSEIDIEALTVRALLNQVQKLKDMKEFPRTLFILDESSLVGNKDMLALEQLSKELGQQLLIVGDFQQNKSISAGHPYKLLLGNGVGVRTLDTNVRLKVKRSLEATKAVYKGDIANTINNIRVLQIKDGGEAVEKMADEYMVSIKSSPGSGRTGITILNKDRVAINNSVRMKLKSEGMLGDKGLEAQILVPRKDLLETDKTRGVSYEVGDIIQFSRGFGTNIPRGEYCKVLRYNPKTKFATVKSLGTGKQTDWSPNLQKDLNSIAVFRPSKREDLRAYDSIIWRAPDEKRGIVNGEKATVLGVNPGGEKQFTVELASGKQLTLNADDPKNQHWDYSYTVTSYMVQGRTIKDNLFYVSTKGVKELSPESMLVIVTRGDNVLVITDDVQKLAKMFDKNGRLPETALELIQDGWGKEFDNKFQPNIKGAASDAPSKIFSGQFDYLKKVDKCNEYLDANRKAGYEYFKHKERVSSVGYEIAGMVKAESVASLEKRNELAYGICQNIGEYQKVLEGNGLDVEKIKAQGSKHQEKLGIENVKSVKVAYDSSDSINVVYDAKETIAEFKEQRDVMMVKHLNNILEHSDYLDSKEYLTASAKKDIVSNGLLDWNIALKSNLDLGKKFAGTSKELDMMLSHDAKVLDKVDAYISHQNNKDKPVRENSKLARVQSIVRGSKSIANTSAERYIQSRSVDLANLSKDVMFNPRVYEPETRKKIPALVGVARDKLGKVQSCEVMFLDGDKRAAVKTDKRSFGRKVGSAVCVQQGKGDTVLLAEGLFTAMSAATADKNATVYASLGSNGLDSFEVPEKLTNQINNIIILADNDGKNAASQKAVEAAVKNISLNGYNVSVVMPDMIDGKKTDLNDVLQKFGIEKAKEVLADIKYQVKAVTQENLVKDIQDGYVKNIVDAMLQKQEDLEISQEAKKEQDRAKSVTQAGELYKNSKDMKGTIAEKYFDKLGITSALPSHFRFHESVKHPELKNEFPPAVVAPIQDKGGVFQGVVKAYIEKDGSKLNRTIEGGRDAKVQASSTVELGKKTGNFVLINKGEDNKNLYLTKSIEDGLSISPSCKDSTVLSVLSLQNFKNIVPSKDTKEIVICVSREDINKNSYIVQAVEHFKDKGLEVSVRLPDSSKAMDLSFHELAKEQGRDAVSDSLNKPMAVSKGLDNAVVIAPKDDALAKASISAPKQENSQVQSQVVQQQRQVDIDRQLVR